MPSKPSRCLLAMADAASASAALDLIQNQLKARSIPYTLQQDTSGNRALKGATMPMAGLLPTICLQSVDLLKEDRAADVAMPRIYMNLKSWWEGGKCQVRSVQLITGSF